MTEGYIYLTLAIASLLAGLGFLLLIVKETVPILACNSGQSLVFQGGAGRFIFGSGSTDHPKEALG
jgi:hypothetical protein